MKNPNRCQRLSEKMSQQLDSYARAAAAAGVGVLALSASAEAKIVYTPVHRAIDCCEAVTLDLNHDGVADFQLQWGTSDSHAVVLGVSPMQSGNQVRGVSLYASALPKGATIESGWQFQPNHQLMASFHASSTSGSRGKWTNVKNRYLGVKFFIKGKIHYGWARLSVRVKGFSITATLTGYAYETVANKGIVAGKTKGPDSFLPDSPAVSPKSGAASLGRLAAGYPGLATWRNANQEP
jgi:hypothetical protein